MLAKSDDPIGEGCSSVKQGFPVLGTIPGQEAANFDVWREDEVSASCSSPTPMQLAILSQLSRPTRHGLILERAKDVEEDPDVLSGYTAQRWGVQRPRGGVWRRVGWADLCKQTYKKVQFKYEDEMVLI